MAEYANREHDFNASLGQTMGGWMLEIAKADLFRQRGWVDEIVRLATPDKNGNIPMVTLTSGLKGEGGKALSEADMSFPVVLALMGQQFAGTEADLSMTMNVSASTLDETQGEQKGSAEGSGSGSVLGFHVGVKVSASFSESEDHKRESDYRATTSANLKMARVPTPEPIQRVLEAYMTIVDVEAKLAQAAIGANATAQAQAKGPDPGRRRRHARARADP